MAGSAAAHLTIPATPRRYYDQRSARTVIMLLQGQHYVTDDPAEMIGTVLGSCIAACIRDPASGIGGMNHFMLPGRPQHDWNNASYAMRYGHFAMEVLINEIVARGGNRFGLEVKLFGGGNVIVNGAPIGSDNARFARAFVADSGLLLAAEDLEGKHARSLRYMPATGEAFRRLLQPERATRIVARDRHYRDRLMADTVGGAVELFD